MILDLTQLALLGILCASIHWLVARSEIAKPFWSRTSGWLAKLLACAGCSGFWLGAISGVTNLVAPVAFNAVGSPTWLSFGFLVAQTFITGVLGIFVTPIFESLLLWGLSASALQDDVDEDDAPEPAAPRLNQDAIDTPVSNPSRRRP
jgi:hypothetical protein